MSSKRLNLANQTLTIGFCNEPPFVAIRYDDQGQIHRMVGGFETQIIGELARHFNFTMKVIDFQLQYGRRTENGTWTGMIGAVARNEVDLAFGGVLMSDDRHRVVRYIHSYFLDQVTFVTLAPLPAVTGSQLDIFLHPFDWPIWLALAACFIMVFFADLIWPSSLVWAVICILFRQTPRRPWRRRRRRRPQDGTKLLSITWLLSTMILGTVYGASLCSMLAVPRQDLIDTVQKLVAACLGKRVAIIAHGNTSIFNDLLNLDDPVSRVIRGAVFRPAGWTRDTSVPQMVADALRSPKPYVMLTTRERLTFGHFRTGQRLFYVPPAAGDDRHHQTANFYNTPLGMPIGPNFVHRVPFEQLVIQMSDTGLIEFWRRREYKYRPNPESNLLPSVTTDQFSLAELANLFRLFLIGVAVSVAALAAESVCRLVPPSPLPSIIPPNV